MEDEEFDPKEAIRQAQRRRFEFYEPLVDTINDPPEPTIQFGLPSLDDRLGGGLAPGPHLVVGYTHNGKSKLCEMAVHNNRDRTVVYIAPDETVDMIISKLMRMDDADPEVPMDERRAWAAEKYPNLVVLDRNLDTDSLERFLVEVEVAHGAIDLIIYDYLSLLRGRAVNEEPSSKMAFLKGVAKEFSTPIMIVHQGSRSGSAGGKPLNLSSGAYGGEQEAFTVMGVYQRKFDPDLPKSELARIEDNPEMIVQVLKNKQSGTLSMVGDKFLFNENGTIREPSLSDRFAPTPMQVLKGR